MKQGIRNIIGAAFCFALMNLFVQLSGDVPVIQKCFFRNIVALLLSIGTLIKTKQKFVIGKGNTKYLFLRAFFGTLGLVCNFYAIDHLNSISDASILNKLSPFFAILFSILLLKERPNKKEIAAIVIAFCGALFVIRPSINMECLPALIGVFGGLCAGLAYTCVRKLGQLGEKGAIIIFFFSGFSTITFLPYLLLHYSLMTPALFVYQIGRAS